MIFDERVFGVAVCVDAVVFLILVFLHGTDVRSDRAWVFFDEDLKLTHVGSTFDADNATYGIPPWSRGTD